MKYTIDATNKKLGRVSSEIAILLMGKNSVDFARNVIPNIEVTITNASKINIDTNKKETAAYKWYSGYPGGLRDEKLKDALAKKGYGEVLRRTVYGMLPSNKLRSRMIKNLTISE